MEMLQFVHLAYVYTKKIVKIISDFERTIVVVRFECQKLYR